MSDIFGREAEWAGGAGDAIRTQVFQADEANAHDGVPMLLIDSQRFRRKALHHFGILKLSRISFDSFGKIQ